MQTMNTKQTYVEILQLYRIVFLSNNKVANPAYYPCLLCKFLFYAFLYDSIPIRPFLYLFVHTRFPDHQLPSVFFRASQPASSPGQRPLQHHPKDLIMFFHNHFFSYLACGYFLLSVL
jgi:hypothetical protein